MAWRIGSPALNSADNCWLNSKKASVLTLPDRFSDPNTDFMPTPPEVPTEKTRKPSRSSLRRTSRSAVASMVRVIISPVGVPNRQTNSAISYLTRDYLTPDPRLFDPRLYLQIAPSGN